MKKLAKIFAGVFSVVLISSAFSNPANAALNTLTVSSPTAGTLWQEGSVQTINWNVSSSTNSGTVVNPATNVFINLNPSTNCSATLATSTCPSNVSSVPYIIAENIPDSGSYTWQVPNWLSPQYTQGPTNITVGLMDSSAQGTSNNFNILPSGAPANAVNIISPTTSTNWQVGSNQNITWASASAAASSSFVTLQLIPSGNAKSTSYVIAQNIPNSGSYSGTINSLTQGQTIQAGQYNLNIIDASNGAVLGSAGPFTLSAAPINLTTQPTVTGINPGGGGVGQSITVIGTNFLPTGNTVNFGTGTFLTNLPSSNNGTTITFTVPNQATPCAQTSGACTFMSALIVPGDYGISVTNSNGTSNTLPFMVTGTNTGSSSSTPVSPAVPINPFAEGSVVQISGSPTVYLIRNGQLMPFSNAKIFMAMGYTWPQVQTISNQQEEPATITISFVPAPDGSIIKASDDPTIYLIVDGQKSAIPSMSVFNRLGLHLNNLIILGSAEVNSYTSTSMQR